MSLPPEAIKEFKVLYKKEFGVDLSDEEATMRANNLVGLYDAVYSPVKKEWLDEFDKKEK